MPVFPRDYPDSVFYDHFIENIQQENSKEYLKRFSNFSNHLLTPTSRPKPKRINFAKLGIPHPFRPNWQYWMKVTNIITAATKRLLLGY